MEWTIATATIVFKTAVQPGHPLFPYVAGAGGLGGAGALWMILTERGRWLAGKIVPIVPLFTRIMKPQALKHPRRQRLHDHVVQRPGRSLADLRRDTGLHRGTLVYHLRVLKGHGLLRMKPEGLRIRVFPSGPPKLDVPYTTDAQEDVIATLAKNPGASQSELARRLGVTRQRLAYQVKQLEQRGLVRAERDGRAVRYYADGAG